MNELHEHLMRILLDIDEVLTRAEIPYYVVGGASIGCVRDGHLIPWDDDIDLVFEDIHAPRIGEALVSGLNDRYIVELPNTRGNPRSYFRVVERDTTLIRNPNEKYAMGVAVELFSLVRVPDEGLPRKLYFGLVKGYMLLNDSGNITPRSLLFIGFGFKKVIRMMMDRLSSKHECSRLSALNGLFFNEIVPVEYFGTPTRRIIEGHPLPFPEHLEKYLEWIYGDYMAPPPESGRKPTYVILDLEKGWENHMEEARRIRKGMN